MFGCPGGPLVLPQYPRPLFGLSLAWLEPGSLLVCGGADWTGPTNTCFSWSTRSVTALRRVSNARDTLTTMFYNFPMNVTWLHYITLHYITLHYITLHYITLHYITLHYITLQCSECLDGAAQPTTRSGIWTYHTSRLWPPLHRRSRSLLRTCPCHRDPRVWRDLEEVEDNLRRDLSVPHHQLPHSHWGENLLHFWLCEGFDIRR